MSANKKNKDGVSIPSIEQVENERKALKKKKEYTKASRNVFAVLVVVAALSVLVATLIMPVLQISGISMEPTLRDREIVVLFKNSEPKSGDIIGFYYQSKVLLKRVIGQPGDVIDMDSDGRVYVNGKMLDEPYVSESNAGERDIDFPFCVPENKYFVLGDNRKISVDSRSAVIGCVEKEQIIGVVFFRAWPLKSISTVK